MRFSDVIKTAFYNLWRKKFRTVLTILAIVIGAILIALMFSIGTGLKGFIFEQFGIGIPEDALTVYAGEVSFYYNESPRKITDNTSGNTLMAFTAEDVENIQSIEGVERVDYSIYVTALYVTPQDSDDKYTVYVRSGPDYEMNLVSLVSGDYLEEDDSGLCLIYYDYLEAFGWSDAEDALGKEVTLTIGKYNAYSTDTKDYTFTVSGVIQKTANSKKIVIPMGDAIEIARYYMDNPALYSPEQPGTALSVKVSDIDAIDRVAEAIDELGFTTITPTEIKKEINTIFNIIQIGLGSFGVIALVIASIGIINTLMMSIHERTREIGVMKAVGATGSTIRLLFTIEGTALGLLGGIFGLGIGYGAGYLLNIVGSQTFLSDYPTFQLSIFTVELAIEIVAITTAISLLASLYPAHRAAKLDAVEALRYE